MKAPLVLAVLLAAAGLPARAHAQDGGRLLATAGVTTIDGAGGGGLVPWALITGYGSRDAIGANAHDTVVYLPDFTVQSAGASIGLYDRLELSYTHDWFDTGQAGARLGLGRGYQLHLDAAGAKVRLFGKVVYDQDSWLPQISIGTDFKSADRHALLRAIGARSTDGADFYLAATKLFLAQSLLVDVTVRGTQANQFGLLGFGGDRRAGYTAQVEGSAALLLTRKFAIGGELRTMPDNLGFAHEDDTYDLFAAWFINRHLSATLAYVDLGAIARQSSQNGVYLSFQAGF